MKKLSQNENPYGASPLVVSAMSSFNQYVHRYPEPHGAELKKIFGNFHHLTADSVLVTAGLVEAIDILVRNFLHGSQNMVVSEFSFVAYRLVANIHHKNIRFGKANGFSLSVAGLLNACDDNTRFLFIDNPNNPTGSYLSHAELELILDSVPKNTMVVLDESYCEYATESDYPDSMLLIKKYPNMIVLRSFSKIHGLAGLRIGYVLARPEFITELDYYQPPFTVNQMAAQAAPVAIHDTDYIVKCKALNHQEREKMVRGLKDAGFQVLPSQSNFLFVYFNSKEERDAYYDILIQHEILTGKMDAFGADFAFRVSIGLPEHNLAFLDTMRTHQGAFTSL